MDVRNRSLQGNQTHRPTLSVAIMTGSFRWKFRKFWVWRLSENEDFALCEALKDNNRSNIDTFHSVAARLLALLPMTSSRLPASDIFIYAH